MATTQKKKGGSRAASSGGRRTASSSSSSRSRSSTSGSRKKQPPQPAHQPFRREIGAVACLLLALFSALGYFHIEALFIDFFCGLVKGLIGYGFWLVPPALLLTSYILAFHRGRPVCLPVVCALLMPLMMACTVHGLTVQVLPWDGALLKTLWESGRAMTSGGAAAGVLAQALVQAVSVWGSTVVFVLAFLLMALGAFRLTILDVADWIFNRPQYEPQEIPERPSRTRTAPSRAAVPEHTSRRAAEIDIPVEDGPLVGKEPAAAAPVEKKKGFFDRRPRVPTPDQVLAAAAAQVRQPEPQPAPAPAPVTEPVPQPAAPAVPPEPDLPEPEENPTPSFLREPEPAPAAELVSAPAPKPLTETPPPPMPEVVREPAVSRSGRDAERQQAAQEMAQHIQAGMELETPPYQHPPLELLTQGSGELGGEALVELNANKQRLSDTIHSFGIDANIVNVTRGPSVTRYELELDQGVRLNKLTNLSDDIALSLGASGVRIAPIPGKISMVGIEVPNKLVSPVNIRTVLSSSEFQDSPSKVSFAVGKDIGGKCIVGNIAKLPHLLIAGATGSGKSVCINSIILSLLYKSSPDKVRLLMIDPKVVELGVYNGIPHLLVPVVTDPRKAAGALGWAVTEMLGRYKIFADCNVRDLQAYNRLAATREDLRPLPQIVIIIDELADLMMAAPGEVEDSICRLAQLARAAGMHLVIATQRPSVNVITGIIKANIPTRIAFSVSSQVDSRTMIDHGGAEKLLGNGDMLFVPSGINKPMRVQGAWVSDQEVHAITEYIKQRHETTYDEDVVEKINQSVMSDAEKEEAAEEYDPRLPEAVEIVIEAGQASISMLQRRMRVGYARAGRLIDDMAQRGIVSEADGAKPRTVLITREQYQQMFEEGEEQ